MQDPASIPPVKKNPVDYIPAMAGHIFNYQIPDDAFQDVEDGGTQQLDLHLSKIYSGNSKSTESWLLLDTANQVLYGLPLETDASEMEVVGLSATDKCGLKVVDAISIHVDIVERPHYAFVITFDQTFKEIMKDRLYQYKLVQMLEEWLDKKIQILEINLTNCSLTWVLAINGTGDNCRDSEIQSVYDKLMVNNATVDSNLNCHLSPYFTVESVRLDQYKICYITQEHNAVSNHVHSHIKYWLEAIIPTLIFLVLFYYRSDSYVLQVRKGRRRRGGVI